MSAARQSIMPEIATVEEIATYLKVTPRHIYSLLSENKIPAFKVGSSWRFRLDEINTWTRGQHTTTKKKKSWNESH